MKIGNLDAVEVYIGSDEASKVYIGSDLVWEKSGDYWGLCFTAEEANSTIGMRRVGSAPSISLVTSTDGENWIPYTIGTTITLANVGDKVYFAAGEGGNATISNGEQAYNYFTIEGQCAASGNVMSLLNNAMQLDQLPAYCFCRLFQNCTGLTTAPELPATTLASNCYSNMFRGCTSLTSAPVLPATTLANNCYYSMFNVCTSLTTAPDLPATTLATGCYYNMFAGCTSLTIAPTLPATTLVNSCYRQMFSGCTSLLTIRVKFSNFYPSGVLYATDAWVSNVAASGIFDCPSALGTNDTIKRGISHCPTGWLVSNDAYWGLCFKAQQANSTVALTSNGSAPSITLQTSTDGETWTPYTIGDTITLANIDDKVYFAAGDGGNTAISSSASNYHKFVMSGSISASGVVTSLLNKDTILTTIPSNYCFVGLFDGCTSLTTAPMLPATTLTNYCYQAMFYGCTSLTTAPALPATTIAQYCYYNMFNGCTSLTTAPALPATSLAIGCYYNMFQWCTSLTTAPTLLATTLATSCYQNMFKYCTSLTTAPELPATTLASNCYDSMFQGCTSLTTAPDLLATTLTTRCYYLMFSGCTNLASIKVAFTSWNGTQPTNSWMSNVAASGTFECPTELGTDETISRGGNYCPTGWTVTNPEEIIWTYDGLTFNAEQAGSTVRLVRNSSAPTVTLQYTTDSTTWQDYTVGTDITLTNVGDKVGFRAKTTNTTFGNDSNTAFNGWVGTGQLSVSGNINSLLDKDNYATITDLSSRLRVFNWMFSNMTSLVSAENLTLPATTIGKFAYNNMFDGCTNLTTAPKEIGAVTLTNVSSNGSWPMAGMFKNTSITKSPHLHFTNTTSSAYQEMFYGCSNLNEIKLDYTGSFGTGTWTNWVNGVAATGTFYYNGSYTGRGTSSIPSGWTITPFS